MTSLGHRDFVGPGGLVAELCSVLAIYSPFYLLSYEPTYLGQLRPDRAVVTVEFNLDPDRGEARRARQYHLDNKRALTR